MKLITKIRKFFKQIHPYTILIQGIIFIPQMPIYIVSKKKTFYAGIRTFNSLPSSVTIKNANTKFRAVFRKYLHRPSFYTVDKVLHV